MKNLNLKKLIINSLLIGMGTILHQITPPIILGIKPDFFLVVLFIIMFINNDYKNNMLCGIIVGILSAITTALPGAQLPNIIDKIITSNIMFVFIKITRNKLKNSINMYLVFFIGTIISGISFLISLSFIIGLPTNIYILIISVVIPASIVNVISGSFLFNIIKISMKRNNMSID